MWYFWSLIARFKGHKSINFAWKIMKLIFVLTRNMRFTMINIVMASSLRYAIPSRIICMLKSCVSNMDSFSEMSNNNKTMKLKFFTWRVKAWWWFIFLNMVKVEGNAWLWSGTTNQNSSAFLCKAMWDVSLKMQYF